MPLPVELLYLDAQWSSDNTNDAVVTWSTASETNNSHFEIYRSTDGQNYDYVGLSASKSNNGFSSEIFEYTFTDANAKLVTPEYAYYKIKQIDYDLRFEWFGPATLEKSSNDDQYVKVYPNPARDLVRVNVNYTNKENVNITITDMLGKVVKEQIAENESISSVAITDLQTGVYFVHIANNQQQETIKIIVE
jgi:hypothetical protein